MIIDHPEDPSWSTDEKSTSGVTPYDHPPPSYSPPAYPLPINPTAGPSSQYQWQPESSSPSQLFVPAPSREFLSPNPPSPVVITRPSSAPPGSNHNLKRDPLNPPPPSFSRLAPPHPLLPPFPPLTLNSRGTSLDKGFPVLLPMPLYPVTHPGFSSNPYQQLQQQNFIHPFSQRDVLEADWTRFLEDLYITAQLSGAQKIAANVLPLASGSLIGSILFTRGIEKHLKKKRSEPVADLVDTWNQYFFHVRGLHVILAHGPESISGEFDGPAPDWVGANRNLASSYSSDSSSESESRRGQRPGGLLRDARRATIRDRTGGRREERRARRARRKADKYEHYRLVVVPI